jgi:polyhydroxyalkanoate synthesis regulator phasin
LNRATDTTEPFKTIGGGALLAGAGYYFYQAGGDPKVAQKKAEGMSHPFPRPPMQLVLTSCLSADAAKLSHEVKDHLPGSAKELKKDGETAAAQAQAKYNELSRDAKAEASKVDAKLQQYRTDAGKQLDAAGKEINKGIVSI